jgi:DNA polymerase III subunit epsilon
VPSCGPRRRCRFAATGHSVRLHADVTAGDVIARQDPAIDSLAKEIELSRVKPAGDGQRWCSGLGAGDHMREIVFDTETTGLDPYQGHRLVEIGCIELVNRFPTSRTFHRYLNPERDMPQEAFAVHGLSADFLKPQPLFASIAEELLAFIGDAALIAHNATFDLNFLNAELERIKQAIIPRDRLIDTLLLARRKFPGASNRLDDLCARFGIDNSRRTKHGALLDAELLAEVYVELVEARQAQLGLVAVSTTPVAASNSVAAVKVRPAPLAPCVTEAERAAHGALIAALGEKAIWRDYAATSELIAAK